MKIIEWENHLSEYASKTEHAFRENEESYEGLENRMEGWIGGERFVELFKEFESKAKLRFSGKILEIGAGSAWLSAYLSRYSEVESIYALEFSKRRLTEWSPHAFNYMRKKVDAINEKKITGIVGDFNDLRFPDGIFDFVVVDGAIHHALEPLQVIKEGARVLKKGGRFIAFREEFCPSKAEKKVKAGQFDHTLVKSGKVVENIYLKEEWQELFNRAGIETEFFPYYVDLNIRNLFVLPVWAVKISPLRFLNGWLYSKFNIVGTKE